METCLALPVESAVYSETTPVPVAYCRPSGGSCLPYTSVSQTFLLAIPLVLRKISTIPNILLLLLLALQPPLWVVFYSPLAGFSLLACEVS